MIKLFRSSSSGQIKKFALLTVFLTFSWGALNRIANTQESPQKKRDVKKSIKEMEAVLDELTPTGKEVFKASEFIEAYQRKFDAILIRELTEDPPNVKGVRDPQTIYDQYHYIIDLSKYSKNSKIPRILLGLIPQRTFSTSTKIGVDGPSRPELGRPAATVLKYYKKPRKVLEAIVGFVAEGGLKKLKEHAERETLARLWLFAMSPHPFRGAQSSLPVILASKEEAIKPLKVSVERFNAKKDGKVKAKNISKLIELIKNCWYPEGRAPGNEKERVNIPVEEKKGK